MKKNREDYYSCKEICELLSWAPGILFNREDAGLFPRRDKDFRYGKERAFWLKTEVQDLLNRANKVIPRLIDTYRRK